MKKSLLVLVGLFLTGCAAPSQVEFLAIVNAPSTVKIKRTVFPASQTGSFDTITGGGTFSVTDTGLSVRLERISGAGEIRLRITRASTVCFDKITTGDVLEGGC